jgi:hypothetical protein
VIGGTFTGDADVRGVLLAPIDPDSIAGDGFVARLADDGSCAWVLPFGGASDDAVAGVAVTRDGTIGVAATLRGDADVDGEIISTRGLADAALIVLGADGHRRTVALIGGGDYDSAAAIAARGDELALAASYAGEIVVGDTRLPGDGGDGALIAVFDRDGGVHAVHDVAGPGRETVTGLAGAPGGWVAAIAHSAATQVDGDSFGAPSSPLGGAALIARAQ